ncbi:type II toxin-antitoxin system tRNA(fMet)-specific endonuclease VapC [Parafilimonas sp.]|uniref:type II toxin-antitoxin system tRNA(fMet)-specific endonuclease VapC n=1 Tax=Parafilimonas sp. TaxID=1969739 RepID=UPI0039E3EA41
MSYLLDTNICIYIIKKKPVSVFKKFEAILPGEIGISSITLAELYYGAIKSSNQQKNLAALNQFLTPLSIYNFDYASCMEYGSIRTDLEKKETPIGALDTLIAAHAKSLNLILVTNNEKEFNRVDGLTIENWVAPGE